MSEPLCVVCKRAREHGIHQWTGYERLRHPDYHEFTTPTDSAVTCTCASPNNRDGTRREVCPVHRDSAITAEADGCACTNCPRRFRVDFLVSDKLWAEIAPGGGLLCGACIASALERRERFDAFRVVPVDDYAAITAERDRLKVERDTAVRNCQELANETLASLAREKNSPACVAERRANAAEARAAELEAALRIIEAWKLPETGKFWENTDGSISDRPMSYEACYGSNGARDFIRSIARAALTPQQREASSGKEGER